MPAEESAASTPEGSTVERPAKVMRFGSMVAATLNEVRQVDLDEEGRKRLYDLHRRTVEALAELLSDDLRRELEEEVELPGDDTPSEGELRVAQARLVGWMEGLLRGLQAGAMSRQMADQLEERRRRQALAAGSEEEPEARPGYL